MKRILGILLVGVVSGLALVLPALAGAPAGPTNEDCLGCHSDKGPRRRTMQGKEGLALSRTKQSSRRPVHERLECTACHAGIKEVPALRETGSGLLRSNATPMPQGSLSRVSTGAWTVRSLTVKAVTGPTM